MDDEDIKCFFKLFQISIVTIPLMTFFGFVFIQYFPFNLYAMFGIFIMDIIASFYVMIKNGKRRKKVAHNSRDNTIQ